MYLVSITPLWGWRSHEPNKVNQSGASLSLTHSYVSRERGDELTESETSKHGRII